MTTGRIEIDGLPFALSWSVSAPSKRSGNACGDGYLIARCAGRVLDAVVDGSGSGSGSVANDVAQDCLEELSRSLSASLSLAAAFQARHCRLRGTRGAALALAEIALTDPVRLTPAAVGDVDGQLLRASGPGRRRPVGQVQSRGTLGFSYETVHARPHSFGVGDMFLITTDGISRAHLDQRRAAQSPLDRAPASMSPADLTRATLTRFGRGEDDQLALALAPVGAP